MKTYYDSGVPRKSWLKQRKRRSRSRGTNLPSKRKGRFVCRFNFQPWNNYVTYLQKSYDLWLQTTIQRCGVFGGYFGFQGPHDIQTSATALSNNNLFQQKEKKGALIESNACAGRILSCAHLRLTKTTRVITLRLCIINPDIPAPGVDSCRLADTATCGYINASIHRRSQSLCNLRRNLRSLSSPCVAGR